LKKFAYIDTLRAIAILMVVLVHTSQHIENIHPMVAGFSAYCQMGVQLFFVASALTLCLSFQTKESEPRSIAAFYVRRFFRIAPLYYLAIPLYFTLWVVKGRFLEGTFKAPEQYNALNVLSNMSFVHDFVPSAQNNIVPGGWSIGVEMAFYLFFPMLYMFFKKFNFDRKMILSAIFFSLFCNVAINFVFSTYFDTSVSNQSFSYYLILNHLPVFLIGILVFSILRGQHAQKISSFVAVGVFIVFSIFSVLIWNIDWKISFLIVPTLSGASFAGLALLASQIRSYPKLVQRIGILSYPIYILHFICTEAIEPVLVRKWDAILPTNPNLQLFIIYGLNVFFAVAMAWLANKLIEAPGIEIGRRLVLRLHNKNR
jgi:peptidoglycan/LPS O-acetylase OafA/YrhL